MIRSIPGEAIVLSELSIGENAVLISCHGGRGMTGRLTTLGFIPGVEIEMTQNYGHGPLVVKVRESRVALGRGEARKILVHRSIQ